MPELLPGYDAWKLASPPSGEDPVEARLNLYLHLGFDLKTTVEIHPTQAETERDHHEIILNHIRPSIDDVLEKIQEELKGYCDGCIEIRHVWLDEEIVSVLSEGVPR